MRRLVLTPNRNRTGIHWRETGSGRPMLLVMGIGYTSDMWHPVEPLLAAKHRLLLFDNRGVGRSDEIPDGYTIAAMAEDALSVLDAADVDCADVFGLSMGGYVAQEFALHFPDRTGSLVLGATGHGGDGTVHADEEVRAAAGARRHMTPEEGVRALVPYIYDASTPRDRIDKDMDIRLRNYPSQQSYDRQLAAILGWTSADRLPALRAPTLVLHGANDRLVPVENGRRLARMIPGARYCELPDASHIFTTDQPQATVRLIEDFLQR